jgi:hypothetical protein
MNRLGYRWVIERTLSWLNRFRLKIRYEHRADIHLADTVTLRWRRAPWA